jgi:hypothetical protein
MTLRAAVFVRRNEAPLAGFTDIFQSLALAIAQS